MSSPTTPRKRNNNQSKYTKPVQETNNNCNNKFSERQQARTFIAWYKRMIDNERYNLSLYLSDDAILEWFGRTIKTRKKVTAFLKYDMQCSHHDFTTIESIDKIESRHERLTRKDDSILASPLHSPELIRTKDNGHKRRLLRSNCSSPEWSEGCQPLSDIIIDIKPKTDNTAPDEDKRNEIDQNALKRSYPEEDTDVCNKGDGVRKVKRKCVSITPPNQEVGQGDCLPSTSGTDSDRSHDTLNAQLPKLAVECNGYIEFARTRNSRSSDAMTWERKCKVQISYSEDPLNVGEYIIWALRYADESKCRRNLLAAFEEVALEQELKKI
ncbi:uncharacterized protein LOC113500304 [Trichoplusia ni]|uniref:Uncharacterized protein LOC113499975 n=1 Tax=Trichoplusia ni TaxID=7111 RepID=A0A7E5W8N6_TRINI|nr:uncharacterized protein LOC113499975 [Trichoplusia ni]XP_026736847.1 uncharacterized protein LOC113500304 [Trichoplusia ni]